MCDSIRLTFFRQTALLSWVIVLGAVLCASTVAQSAIKDLQDELDSGQVVLISASGNGSSTGTVISGYLENRSTVSKRININFKQPLFLINSGRGQNMVSLQIYLSDGGYTSDGTNEWIALAARSKTSVKFLAFCVDFEKENPTYSDRFSIGTTPTGIRYVLMNIRSYILAHPDEDIGAAGQAALWMAQGISMSKIRAKFDVSYSEEQLARQFLR